MSTGPERPLVAALRHELNALRGHWFWFVPLGIARVVLGPIALVCLALVRCHCFRSGKDSEDPQNRRSHIELSGHMNTSDNVHLTNVKQSLGSVVIASLAAGRLLLAGPETAE